MTTTQYASGADRQDNELRHRYAPQHQGNGQIQNLFEEFDEKKTLKVRTTLVEAMQWHDGRLANKCNLPYRSKPISP